jgi:hypothetical protein
VPHVAVTVDEEDAPRAQRLETEEFVAQDAEGAGGAELGVGEEGIVESEGSAKARCENGLSVEIPTIWRTPAPRNSAPRSRNRER